MNNLPWKTAKSGFTQAEIYVCDCNDKILFSTLSTGRTTAEAEETARQIVKAANLYQIVVNKVVPAITRAADSDNTVDRTKEEIEYARSWLIKAGVYAALLFCLFTPALKAEPVVTQAAWYGNSDKADMKRGLVRGVTDDWAHKKTASGEAFDETKLTCAMRSRGFGKKYKFTNLENGKSVVVKHTDFGPGLTWKDPKTGKVKDLSKRKADLSKAAYARIADLKTGVINVKIEKVS